MVGGVGGGGRRSVRAWPRVAHTHTQSDIYRRGIERDDEYKEVTRAKKELRATYI